MAGRWLSRLGWSAAVAVGVGLAGWALAPKPVEVETGEARETAFERTIDAEGKTRVRDRYVVSAPLAGRLLRTSLKAGDRVEPGMTVAVIVPSAPLLLDTRTMQELTERVGAAEADLDRARAATERAEVALALAQSELARQRSLADKGFTSAQAIDRAQRDAELKDRDLAAARFEQHAAEHRLAVARNAVARLQPDAVTRTPGGRWTIRSPVAGRVLKVLQESETAVASGAPLLEIGNPEELEVVADLLTADAAIVPRDAAVSFDVGGGAPLRSGRVRLVEPGAFTKISALGVEEQRVNVVMDFVPAQAGGAALGDGYRVDVRIVVDQRDRALVIPVAALFRVADVWAVYVLDGSRARARTLDVATRGGRWAVVARGLAPGERVIVYPSDAVRDGVRVRVREDRWEEKRR